VRDDVSGLPTPDYHLPFEAEVGAHPSFEEMQVAVARSKLRPAFPDMWKNTNMVTTDCIIFYILMQISSKQPKSSLLLMFRPLSEAFIRRSWY